MLKRKLFFFERLMYVDNMPDMGIVNILGVMRLDNSITLEQLQAALRLLQVRHPCFRAYITHNHRIVYNDDVGAPIPVEIIERTSDLEWLEVQKRVIKTRFDFEKSPLLKLFWVKNDEDSVSDIVYVMPHLIADGRSLSVIFRDIMAYLNRPETVPTPYAPFANIKEIVPRARFTWGNKFGALLYWVPLVIRTLRNMRKKPIKARGGKFYAIRQSLDVDTSTAIKKLASQHHVSNGNLIGMLFFDAFRKIYVPKRKTLVCNFLMDIRHYFSAVKRTMIFPFSPSQYLVVDMPTSDENFWECTARYDADHKNMMQEYMKVKQRAVKKSFARMVYFLEFGKWLMPWWIRNNFYLSEEVDLSFSDFGPYPSYNSGTITGRMTWMCIIQPWHRSTYIGLSHVDNEFIMGGVADEDSIPQETMLQIFDEFKKDLGALLQHKGED